MAPRLPERLRSTITKFVEYLPDWLYIDPSIHPAEIPYQRTSQDQIVHELGQLALREPNHDQN